MRPTLSIPPLRVLIFSFPCTCDCGLNSFPQTMEHADRCYGVHQQWWCTNISSALPIKTRFMLPIKTRFMVWVVFGCTHRVMSVIYSMIAMICYALAKKMLPSGKRDDLYCCRPSCFVTWHDNNYLPSITAIHYFLIITICSKMMMIDYLPCGWLKLLFCFDSGLSTSMHWLPRLPFRFLFSSQTLKSSSKGFDKALLTKVLVSPW
mgnify:CR=1 FL=1